MLAALCLAPLSGVVRAQPAPSPPPVCTLPPQLGMCIPPPYDGPFEWPSPLRFDTPTLDVLPEGQESVTFTITDYGMPYVGGLPRPPEWVVGRFRGVSPGSSRFDLRPQNVDDCAGGTKSCTYILASNGTPVGGWYIADVFANQKACPPSVNGVLNCSAVTVGAAVYVPERQALEPPAVRLTRSVAGHVVKVRAIALDPLGQPLSLRWEFGDGTLPVDGALDVVATHTYSGFGKYGIVARVTAPDSRSAAATTTVSIVSPSVRLRGLGRIDPPLSDATVAIAWGDAPEWAPGSIVTLRSWDNGCPADPGSLEALQQSTPLRVAQLAADRSFSIRLPSVPPAANAVAVDLKSWVSAADGLVREVTAVSRCIGVGQAALTTGATAAGAAELPVPSITVPIGNVALVDAGTPLAELRLVAGHGSLIFETALAQAHDAGAVVLDLGPPPPPDPEDPPPPADPEPPTPFDGTATTTTIPGATTTTTLPACAPVPSLSSVVCRLDAVQGVVQRDASSYRQRKGLLALFTTARQGLDRAAAPTVPPRKLTRFLNGAAQKLGKALRLAKKKSVPAPVRDGLQQSLPGLIADVRGLRPS